MIGHSHGLVVFDSSVPRLRFLSLISPLSHNYLKDCVASYLGVVNNMLFGVSIRAGKCFGVLISGYLLSQMNAMRKQPYLQPYGCPNNLLSCFLELVLLFVKNS